MKAIEKAMNDQARNHRVNWINVLAGNSRVTIDPSRYYIKASTFRKQANAEGFRTITLGDEIQLYR